MIQIWFKFNFFTMNNSLTRIQILRQIFTMRNRWIDCMSFFHSKFASEFVIEKSIKLNIFRFFVRNLRQILRQITSMKYWLYFTILTFKINYKKAKKTFREKKSIFYFRSESESDFASNFVNEKSMKLNIFCFFVQNLRQILRQISSMRNQWNWIYFIFSLKICFKIRVRFLQCEINEIDYMSFFRSKFASEFVFEKSMKLNIFHFFVKNLRQNLRQISSMRNRRNWFYFIFLSKICVKFCVRFRQCEIDKIECISFFRSKFESNFASNYINKKLIVFYNSDIQNELQKSEKNFSRKKIYFLFSFRICVRVCVRFRQ